MKRYSLDVMKTSRVYHQELLRQLQQRGQKGKSSRHPEGYEGTTHPSLYVTTTGIIARQWVQTHKDISLTDFLSLLDLLFAGESKDEKMLAGKILGYVTILRRSVLPTKLVSWLEYLEGWAEIDSLCQSTFTAEEMLGKWSEWENLLENLNRSENINKRRASLVLLTGVVGKSADPRLSKMAFKNIDNLKFERDILITKAISWLLRDLTSLNRQEVEQYLKDNFKVLPAIAVRETRNKLETGRK